MDSVISLTPSEDREVEVSSKATRRVFTAKYKERILREAEACAGQRGAVGALLRREGIYSSHLTAWRKEARAGLEAKKRGPKQKVDARDRQITELERKLDRVTQRAERAETLVELQKKVSQLLGIAMAETPTAGGS
jgi:transposase-like protein